MIDRRVSGQSQLDYLWTNFGEFAVSSTYSEHEIPTTKLVIDLVNAVKDNTLSQLQVVGSDLIGYNSESKEIFRIDIQEIITSGKAVTDFGRRYTTAKDVEAGNDLPVNTPVYYLRFSDGTEIIAKIDTYTGSETNTTVITIDDKGQIKSKVKLDNEDTVINLSESSKGIKADLKIDNDEDGIQLSKELEGLKARIILGNPDKVLKFRYLNLQEYLNLTEPNETTVYFIEGKSYFYFGEHKIGGSGSGSIDLSDYYTKSEVDAKISNITNLNWKNI